MAVVIDGTTGISTPAETVLGNLSYTGTLTGNGGIVNLGSGQIYKDASGNVGIGTSSPATLGAGYGTLDIRGSNGGGFRWGNSTNSAYSYADIDGTVISTATAKPLILSTNNTERVRIDSSGNLLVGTTSTVGGARLNIARTDTTTSPCTVNIYNSGATGTTRTANNLIRAASNGNGADVNIQLTDSIANNYYFGGNSTGAYVVANTAGVRLSNGSTSWASDSDERVKDIIEPITHAAEKVSTLRAVIGKYKTDEADKRRAFLIAQDVQAVLPEAVVAQNDEIGTLSLAYTDVIPLLVAAIQEQQTLITALTARITALEGAAA